MPETKAIHLREKDIEKEVKKYLDEQHIVNEATLIGGIFADGLKRFQEIQEKGK